jgi:hypothetical protein
VSGVLAARVEEMEFIGDAVEERERTRGCESMLFILIDVIGVSGRFEEYFVWWCFELLES